MKPTHKGHGWQSPMTPAEAYVYGLRALDDYAQSRFGEGFAELSARHQGSFLWALTVGGINTFRKGK